MVNDVTVARRPPDIEDYIDMLRRYRSWIIGPAFAGLVIAVVVAFLWPDTYVSMAVMKITPQQVSERLVPTAVTSQMAERLNQMETDILSRTRLQAIIEKPGLNLYEKERKRLPMEDVIKEMRNRIVIAPFTSAMLSAPGSKYASAFQIRFSYADKYKAQAVVRELVSMFTEQNQKVLRDQASATTSFFNDELKTAKEKMDDLDSRITKWKIEHQGHLPEQTQANVQALQMERMQLLSLDAQISRDLTDKMMLETQIQTNKQSQTYNQTHLEEVAASPKNEQLTALNAKIAQAKAELAMAKQLYGDAYPEIGARQAALAAMEKERDEYATTSGLETSKGTSPGAPKLRPEADRAIQELKAEEARLKTALAAKQSEIETYRRQRDEVLKQIAAYQRRLEDAPVNEQQYAALQRDLDLAKADYEDMMKRRDASQTALNLEDRKGGETLEVVDLPSLPDSPSEPIRQAWAGMGLLGGLVLGILLAAAKEVKDASLKNLKDVRAYTNLPILSSIPLLENALLVRRKRRMVWLAWSTAIILGCILMTGSMYYHMLGV